jgi:hypothetical protein
MHLPPLTQSWDSLCKSLMPRLSQIRRNRRYRFLRPRLLILLIAILTSSSIAIFAVGDTTSCGQHFFQRFPGIWFSTRLMVNSIAVCILSFALWKLPSDTLSIQKSWMFISISMLFVSIIYIVVGVIASKERNELSPEILWHSFACLFVLLQYLYPAMQVRNVSKRDMALKLEEERLQYEELMRHKEQPRLEFTPQIIAQDDKELSKSQNMTRDAQANGLKDIAAGEVMPSVENVDRYTTMIRRVNSWKSAHPEVPADFEVEVSLTQVNQSHSSKLSLVKLEVCLLDKAFLERIMKVAARELSIENPVRCITR